MTACGINPRLNSSEVSAQAEEVGEIALCESCGWWCESGEIDGSGDCEDCSTEDDGEES